MILKFTDLKGNSYPYLYRDSESQVFYAVAKRKGRVIKISLETKNFAEARGKVLEALSTAQVRPKHRSNRLIFEFFHDLVQRQESDGASEPTMTRMISVWKNSIKPFWGDLGPLDVTDERVVEFIKWHKRMKPGVQLYNVFKYLRAVFRLMNERGVIVRIPVMKVPRDEVAHHKTQKGTIITDEEFELITEKLSPQFQMIAEIAWMTGMRKMEIGKLLWSDVSSDLMATVRAENSKVRRKRVIPLPKSFGKVLRGNPNDFVFPGKSNGHLAPQSIDRAWTKARRKAGIKRRIRFHDLRHTAASRMATSGMNPAVACMILGMSLSIYQKTYLHLSEASLRTAMDAMRLKKG